MKTVNSERLLKELDELANIGASADGGVSRVAFSDADIQGRDWFRSRVEEAGLEYQIDGAGNQSAILHGKEKTAKRILFGSHLDSVPNGGRYDGALGTLVALETLRTLKESSYITPISLEVVNCTSEENVIIVMMGSRAIAGLLSEEDLARAKMEPEEFDTRLSALGISRGSILNAKREDVAAWVELHIEQGTRLEKSGTDIGVVNSIVGIRSFHATLKGEAAHAGTQPMHERKDALWGASQFLLRTREMVMKKYTPGVFNVGNVSVLPGAFNIVPGEVVLDFEFRNGSKELLDQMQEDILGILTASAEEFDLEASCKSGPSCEPAVMDERVVRALESASETCKLSHERMLSFAGHDTQSMARICPSAMYFVPSLDGISHNPAEFTSEQDCINGANLMLNTVLHLIEEFKE